MDGGGWRWGKGGTEPILIYFRLLRLRPDRSPNWEQEIKYLHVPSNSTGRFGEVVRTYRCYYPIWEAGGIPPLPRAVVAEVVILFSDVYNMCLECLFRKRMRHGLCIISETLCLYSGVTIRTVLIFHPVGQKSMVTRVVIQIRHGVVASISDSQHRTLRTRVQFPVTEH